MRENRGKKQVQDDLNKADPDLTSRSRISRASSSRGLSLSAPPHVPRNEVRQLPQKTIFLWRIFVDNIPQQCRGEPRSTCRGQTSLSKVTFWGHSPNECSPSVIRPLHSLVFSICDFGRGGSEKTEESSTTPRPACHETRAWHVYPSHTSPLRFSRNEEAPFCPRVSASCGLFASARPRLTGRYGPRRQATPHC